MSCVRYYPFNWWELGIPYVHVIDREEKKTPMVDFNIQTVEEEWSMKEEVIVNNNFDHR